MIYCFISPSVRANFGYLIMAAKVTRTLQSYYFEKTIGSEEIQDNSVCLDNLVTDAFLLVIIIYLINPLTPRRTLVAPFNEISILV